MIKKIFFSIPVLTLILAFILFTALVSYQTWVENRFAPIIKAAGHQFGIDPLLIKAVIKRESRFKPNARGAKGEIGLMQVTPAVGMECAFEEKLKKFKLEDLYDPALNVHVGAWYLAKAIKRYEAFPDPVPFALAHYNAGASNVDRWLESTNNRGDKDEFVAAITYPGTKSYIEYILNKWRWYKLTSF